MTSTMDAVAAKVVGEGEGFAPGDLGGAEAIFHEFENKEIRLPQATRDHPSELMLRWHWDEVYKA